MNAIASLCEDVAWLDRGQVREVGRAATVISAYENHLLSSKASDRAAMLLNGNLTQQLKLDSLIIQGMADAYTVNAKSEEPITVIAHWRATQALEKLIINMSVYANNTRLMTLDDLPGGGNVEAGTFTTEFVIPANTFRNANLSLAIGGREQKQGRWCWAMDVAKINAIGDGLIDVGNHDDIFMPVGEGQRY